MDNLSLSAEERFEKFHKIHRYFKSTSKQIASYIGVNQNFSADEVKLLRK
jgi:hypothetical protein